MLLFLIHHTKYSVAIIPICAPIFIHTAQVKKIFLLIFVRLSLNHGSGLGLGSRFISCSCVMRWNLKGDKGIKKSSTLLHWTVCKVENLKLSFADSMPFNLFIVETKRLRAPDYLSFYVFSTWERSSADLQSGFINIYNSI